MNKFISKFVFIMATGFLALPVSAATVTLIPSATEVLNGEQFTVDLYMDVSDNTGVADGNIWGTPKVVFDSLLVQYDNFVLGNDVNYRVPGLTVTDGNAEVKFATVGLDQGLLGTFTFTALAEAGGIINLNAMDTSFLTTFFNTTGPQKPIFPDFGEAQVSVVPVPGAVWLLGSGLIGLFGWSRRRSALIN